MSRAWWVAVLLLLLWGPVRGQGAARDSVRLNAVKVNLGMLYYMNPWIYGNNTRRFSIEYTHGVEKFKRLAWTVDMEAYRFDEERLIEVFPGWRDYVVSNQSHWAFQAGARYYPLLLPSTGNFGLYLEPQFVLGLNREWHELTAGSPRETQYMFIPDYRIRLGTRLNVNKRWVAELSLELYREHFLHWVRTEFLTLPELNIGYRL